MNVFDLFPGDNKLADSIAKAVKEDSWSAGDNAWSSEHDQWAKESADVIPALTGVDEDHEDELEIGDEVLVTYPNQFQGKRGEITGFGRNKAFVIVEINGKEYSMHSSDVERLGGAEDWDDEDEDYGTFGDDERDELDEGAEFGAYYYEELAQKVFDKYPDLSTKGSADELLDAGWKIAAQDLGVQRARYEFNYNEDFPSDFVSAYSWLQKGGARHLDEYRGPHDKVTFEVDSEKAYNHIMHKYGSVIDWDGDYMTVPERYWPAVQELAYAAGGDVQEISIDEGWKQNLAALGTAAALGAGGMAAFGGNAPATSTGPEIANPTQVVQQIQAGKITNSQQLQAALSTAKNKNQVWAVLQNTAGMQGSSDADAVVKAIALKESTICPVCGCTPCNCTHIIKEGASLQDVFNAITYRIERQMPELFTDYGVEVVANAIKDVAEFHEGTEELGSSDVGGMVRQVVRQLKQSELRKALDEVKKMSTQQKFEKHLAKHGYDVNAKQKYWDQKIKDIDAQIAAWDAEMAARKQNKGVSEDLGTMAGAAALGSLAAGAIGAGMGHWLKKDREKERAKMDAVVNPKKKKKGVAEETTDVYRKVFKKNGKPVGEVGIDLEAAPGNGDWYVKHYASGTDYSGYDTRQDAIDELKYMVSQGLDEQGVAEGEYDDPRWEPREPDMSRKVDWDIEAERNKPEEQEAAKTVTITDYDGKVVLTFPSTGGFYGDKKYAASKGFDTDSGDYRMSWKRVAESGQGDDSTSPVGGNVHEGYWARLQQERYLKEHKKAFSMLDELNEVFKDK